MQALALGPNGDGTTRRKDKEDNDPTTRRPHHSNSGPAILLELPRVRIRPPLSMDATASMAARPPSQMSWRPVSSKPDLGC